MKRYGQLRSVPQLLSWNMVSHQHQVKRPGRLDLIDEHTPQKSVDILQYLYVALPVPEDVRSAETCMPTLRLLAWGTYFSPGWGHRFVSIILGALSQGEEGTVPGNGERY